MNFDRSIKKWLVAVVGAVMSTTFSAHADEILWDRAPIRIDLLVGVESRVDFPADVRIGVPQEISDKDTLRQESLNGSVYFTAGKPFKTTRVYASLIKSKQVVLLDVTSRDRAKTDSTEPRAPLKVLIPGAQTDEQLADVSVGEPTESDSTTSQTGDAQQSEHQVITPITLARYAAQQLYAPARLIPQNQNIQRVPMRAPKILPQLYVGGDVKPEPIASWSGGGMYVTAVKISNLTKLSIDIDPRKLRGRILHAAFQDRSLKLGPLGSDTATSTIYLITDRPFAESITLKS